jgi:hypothetical protein
LLRLVYVSNALPASFIADPSMECRPGQAAQLTVMGNTIVASISNGTAPIGIIDDMRVRAFSNVSWQEMVLVPAVGVLNSSGVLVSPVDIKADLLKANIIESSFTSTVDCLLNTNNGVLTFPAGTPLNIDLTGSGKANGIKAIVSYTYFVANIPGDDSISASGRVTVWFNRMIFQTTSYESNQNYPLNANLFVSEDGFLTTRKPSAIHPSVGIVTGPPSSVSPMLEVLFF